MEFLDEIKIQEVEYQYDLTKFAAQIKKYINSYNSKQIKDTESAESWKKEVSDFILLQLSPLQQTEENEKQIKEQVEAIESALKQEVNQGFIIRWFKNLMNFVMQKNSKSIDESQLLNDTLINYSSQKGNAKQQGEAVLQEIQNYSLLDKLLVPDKLNELNAKDLKTLYYLSINHFHIGSRKDREVLEDQIESFNNGKELCTKEKMLTSLMAMINERKQLQQEITEQDILELNLAKSETKFCTYKDRISALKEHHKQDELTEEIKLLSKIQKIKDHYVETYVNIVTIPEMANDIINKAKSGPIKSQPKLLQNLQQTSKDAVDSFSAALSNELKKYSKSIGTMDREKLNKFQEKLSTQIISKKGVSISYAVAEALLSVEDAPSRAAHAKGYSKSFSPRSR